MKHFLYRHFCSRKACRQVIQNALLLIFLLSASCSSIQTTHHEKLILTSTAPLYQIALSLTTDTDILVVNIPDNPRSMSSQPTFLKRQADGYAELFSRADAVITLGKLWSGDSLYATARAFNLDVINIDATRPWSENRGVAVVQYSKTDGVNPYFWLSLSNLIRSQQVITADLVRLYPDNAVKINANLEKNVQVLSKIKADFESRFLELSDPVIYALAEEFSYLTNDLGLFVDDYFIRQDIDWTAENYQQLTQHLRQHNIEVVIHKWQPSQEIIDAVKTANAQLVVLDTLELSNRDLSESMLENLTRLYQAFSDN